MTMKIARSEAARTSRYVQGALRQEAGALQRTDFHIQKGGGAWKIRGGNWGGR